MAEKYSDCLFCGGAVEEQLIHREFRWQGQLFIFEDVPIGVCSQCGEKVIKPKVAKALDRIVQAKKKPKKTIKVPVYSYEPNGD